MSSIINEAQAGLAYDYQRRLATRYEPSRRDACLAWGETPSESEPGLASDSRAPRRDFALLLDISHTGAALALDHLPRPGAGVWLRLEGDGPTDWTEAQVVGVAPTSMGPHVIRLAFRAPCPFETLLAAICD